MSGTHAFDPSLARFPTRALPVPRVIDLLEATHAPDRVDAYRRRMAAGDRFPPVSVVAIGPWVFLADGHKRLSAYKALGHPSIVVEVWPWRRWVGNQWEQFVNNGRKNARIVRLLPSDPAAAGRLALTTLGHWRRVALALLRRIQVIS